MAQAVNPLAGQLFWSQFNATLPAAVAAYARDPVTTDDASRTLAACFNPVILDQLPPGIELMMWKLLGLGVEGGLRERGPDDPLSLMSPHDLSSVLALRGGVQSALARATRTAPIPSEAAVPGVAMNVLNCVIRVLYMYEGDAPSIAVVAALDANRVLRECLAYARAQGPLLDVNWLVVFARVLRTAAAWRDDQLTALEAPLDYIAFLVATLGRCSQPGASDHSPNGPEAGTVDKPLVRCGAHHRAGAVGS